MATYDVVTFGETMIRLSTPLGERLETAVSLDVGIGGAESNVAVALSRLGRRTAWASVLPRNAFGERIAGDLRRHGVDVSHVSWAERGRVGVYYLDTGAAPRPTHVLYDRAGSAVARCVPDSIDPDLAARCRILHLTGITPALSPSCAEVTRRLAWRATEAGVPISVDVNYRSLLWSPDVAADMLGPLCTAATVLICGRADARTLWGLEGSDEDAVRALSARFGAATTVLTTGDEGAVALTQDGTLYREPAVATVVIDRVGAGDAFAAGFLHGYLDGDVALALRLGVRLAALKMTIRGDLAVVGAHELAALVGPALGGTIVR
ncbi:MAG TPA: sugar kinase [Thermomicrobiaceae bacterium]|nr:sugar kinase [Thermomicrobiaceae bacterium]